MPSWLTASSTPSSALGQAPLHQRRRLLADELLGLVGDAGGVPDRAILRSAARRAETRHHDREQGTITLAARLAAGLVEFRVQDDGPGIAPRFNGRIFGIFQTLRSRDELECSGIGLAIVKRKVEGRGGTIRVESAPPARGTISVFTWPEAVA